MGAVCESGLSGGRIQSDDRGCPFCRYLLSHFITMQILNFFSPCDGRGSNLFSISYQRMKGTYVANQFGMHIRLAIMDRSDSL